MGEGCRRKKGKGYRGKFGTRRRRKTNGGRKVTFQGGVVKHVKLALRKFKKGSGLSETVKFAVQTAKDAVKRIGGRKHIRIPRIIPLPKTGGFLPFLLPLLSGLSAVGTLAGGAAAITKAVNSASSAKQALAESQRHNKMMEAISLGKKGDGLYVKPYKKGLGLYIKPYPKN